MCQLSTNQSPVSGEIPTNEKSDYLRPAVLCYSPLPFRTEADVGDPGEAGHGVLLGDVGEPDSESSSFIGPEPSSYCALIGGLLTILWSMSMP